METSLTWLDKLIQAPSSDGWRRLSDAYSPLLSRWLARAGVPASDHDDLVQEVLLVVLKRIDTFERAGVGAFRGWLRAILAIQIKKYFREHPHRHCSISIDDVCDPHSQLSAAFDREHDRFLAARAMRVVRGDFEPATWRAFEMQVLENAPPRVVADSLGLSLNAAIKAKSRVLKRLREELARIVD